MSAGEERSAARWFHTIVIVGATLAAAPGCGGSNALERDGARMADSAAGEPDARDAGADTSSTSDRSDTAISSDAGRDQVSDAVIEYRMILIP